MNYPKSKTDTIKEIKQLQNKIAAEKKLNDANTGRKDKQTAAGPIK